MGDLSHARYLFSDGTPVTAQHIAECLGDQNTNHSNAQSSLGAITVTATNGVTVRIESERATHVMDAVLAEWPFVVYTKDPDGNFVFTGPFVIGSFSEEQIDLVPNDFCPEASQRSPIMLKNFADGHDLADSVKNLDVVMGSHLPIDTLPDLRSVDGVNIKSFEVGHHYMIFYNTDTLDDVRVRQAFDLAIDRTALSQALAGGHATRNLFRDTSPFFSDDSDPHGDRSASEALLSEAGWTLSSNGKREKDGSALTVNLVAYPLRPGLVTMQPIIAESLMSLGVTVNSILTGQDWPETQQIIDDRSFDMLMWAQHTLPAGDPLWFLSTFFRSDGGSNHANIQSAAIDSRIDSLSLVEQHDERVFLAQATQQTIHDLVPVSNLVTPFWHVSLSDRLANYEVWGSDYYAIRPDLIVVPKVQSGSSRTGQGLLVSTLICSLTTFLVLLFS